MIPRPPIPLPPREETRWTVSSYSGRDNNCVEIGEPSSRTQAVRDTKDAARRTTLTFPAASWQPFLEAIARETL
ncbi:DUF397 domain-containing protein [Streptomyces huiliensis]|uniref:DUF397 domain-containing protein n=1 Tax=Streptomyces huiliensis TaxID=2876027 RepID=UPI001CC12D44|nr:DUF397 domain-containing protein [Streptomyces huiliensis]MBZ4318936.1 DUF397 domain-containing protein [Streptomyces huiliensis]